MRSRAGRPNRAGRRGFTLVELLVVVGIVLVLLALILTGVAGVRKASQTAATGQLLNALQAAIEQYRADYRAFPGPLTDEAVHTGAGLPAGLTSATMAENLTLGLLGGLRPVPGGPPGATAFDRGRVGRGTINMSPTSPSTPKNYIQAAAVRGMISQAGEPFRDATGRTANDSVVPEFVDRFADPLPVLYLRARPGTAGIMSDETTPGGGKTYQYDLRQVVAYTRSNIGLEKPGQSHGLRELGNSTGIPPTVDGAPNEALRYFRQPGPPEVSPTDNATGTPRQKDRYILISAGRDRMYGTADDVTSFGSVAP